MDFFEHQDVARRRTRRLIVYYAAAVALIVAAVYTAVDAIYIWGLSTDEAATAAPWWNPLLFAWVAGATLAIVTLGTAWRIHTLAQGGEAVARMLDGRPVDPASIDPAERRLLNVVEEMAIASGVAVPRVFVMDQEPGINAFAAGFAPGDAVIGVTAGTLNILTREELQGVIGHEFSHILNGDMRLNIRLMGVLYGILVIAMVGYWVFRIAMRSGGGRSRSSKKGSPLPFILLGLALMIIGRIGVFFAQLIKSAVSRQREFLADASAVQFTRNPAGLAGALKKIGAFSAGSRMLHPGAEELSHLFFAKGGGFSLLSSLFATHPPLAERIRILDPSFDGTFPAASATPHAPIPPRAFAPPQPVAAAAPMRAATIASFVGNPAEADLTYAAGLIERIPTRLASAARSAHARSLVYALLLSPDPAVRSRQVAALAQRAPADRDAAERLAPDTAALPPELRLPLADLVMPALRGMSRDEYPVFRDTVEQLVVADDSVDLFEYALHRALRHRLDPVLGGVRPTVAQYYSARPLAAPIATVLSSLARWDASSEDGAAAAYTQAIRHIGAAVEDEPLRPAAECSLSTVDQALNQLALAAAPIKRVIVAACAAAVGADQKVTAQEAELLRAVADALECPVPPLPTGTPPPRLPQSRPTSVAP